LLEFHVRATGAGRLSDVLVYATSVGDTLRVGPARGTLTLAPPSGRSHLLVAGGTGLAPIRALLSEQDRRGDAPTTWLFVGARTPTDLYDLPLLTEYARQWSWLRMVLAVSGTPEPALPGPDGRQPEYQSGDLVDVVTRHGDWTGFDAYLGGPWPMVAELRRRLPGLGVPAERIRYDLQ
jgi:NAD(P)H-flavin reductase